MDADTVNVLEGFIPDEDFAAAGKISPRTLRRYRNQPDGMPFLEWGGRVYIPVEAAREWIRNRIRHPNPTARKRIAA
jgi:hypothetical protein